MKHEHVRFGILFLFTYFVHSECDERSDQLRDCLENEGFTGVVIENTDGKTYEDVAYQWNLRKRTYPKGFLLPESENDVVDALICLKQLDIKFAVKGGGHSGEKYSYGNSTAWVIDLANFDSIDMNESTWIAKIGAGTRFLKIFTTLYSKWKRGIPTGICHSVCIGGYTQGGGFSVLSRRFGMGSDNVVKMKVVTADFKILDIDATREKDLFWALRGGGGGSFAIVLYFHYKTFDASGKVVSSVTKYKGVDDLEALYRNWTDYLRSQPPHSIGSLLHYENDSLTLQFVIKEDAVDKGVAHLKKAKRVYFPHINLKTDMQILNHNETMYRMAIPFYSNESVPFVYRTRSFYVNRYITPHEINKLVTAVRAHKYCSLLIEAFGGRISEISKTDSAFCHRDSKLMFVYGYNVYTADGKTPEEAIEEAKGLELKLEYFRRLVSFMDSGESYVGNIDINDDNWGYRYFCKNFDRLKKIKARYDKGNLFEFPQSIPLA